MVGKTEPLRVEGGARGAKERKRDRSGLSVLHERAENQDVRNPGGVL